MTHVARLRELFSDRNVMTTDGFATVGEILEIPLPGSRDWVNPARSVDCMPLRTEVLDFLYHQHDKPEFAEAG